MTSRDFKVKLTQRYYFTCASTQTIILYVDVPRPPCSARIRVDLVAFSGRQQRISTCARRLVVSAHRFVRAMHMAELNRLPFSRTQLKAAPMFTKCGKSGLYLQHRLFVETRGGSRGKIRGCVAHWRSQEPRLYCACHVHCD